MLNWPTDAAVEGEGSNERKNRTKNEVQVNWRQTQVTSTQVNIIVFRQNA